MGWLWFKATFLFFFALASATTPRHDSRFQGVQVFPYVTAGDTSKMVPATELQPEAVIPPPLPSVPTLEGTHGAAALRVSAGTFLRDRFGTAVFFYVVIVSFAAFPFFAWFSFAGGAMQVSEAYSALFTSFALQAIVLAMALSAGLSSTAAIIMAVLSLGAGFAAGWFSAAKTKAVDRAWASMIGVNFLFQLLNALNGGELGIVRTLIPGRPQLSYWLCLLTLTALVTVAVTFFSSASMLTESLLIAVICSFGAIGGLSVLCEILGVVAPFDFVKYFSPPLGFSFASVACLSLLLILIGLVAFGTWLNQLRFKQQQQRGGPLMTAADREASYVDNPWA